MSKKNSPDFVFPAFQGMMPKAPKMPAMPPFPPMPEQKGKKSKKGKKGKKNSGNFNSSMTKYWKQLISLQKSSVKDIQDQWNTFFEYNMAMWDTVIGFLPDEVPFLPEGVEGISPKRAAKRVKKFQKMANKHLVEQAESAADFAIKGQEQVRDMVSTAMDKVEKKDK